VAKGISVLDDTKKSHSVKRKTIRFSDSLDIEVYPRSIVKDETEYIFMGSDHGEKHLWILSRNGHGSKWESAGGESLSATVEGDPVTLKRCPLDHHHAVMIRKLYTFTAPSVLGPGHSIGLGDRLGLAGPGHIRAVEGTPVKSVLAQQSIRELERTERSPGEVIDAATWAVLQEGFREPYGADADHLKSKEDIDLTVAAGFTMYTIDPGNHVDNEADICPPEILREKVDALDWSGLEDTLRECQARYAGRDISIGTELTLHPDAEAVHRALGKYGRALAHTVSLSRYLIERMAGTPFELEVSVDETDSVTTPFEHYFIAGELNRLGVSFISLAPRFIGDFEKGIDYKGDLHIFEEEYRKHILIARQWGSYKISFHSGSDKFSVYEIAGRMRDGAVHVKTAGTSYLVALQTISLVEPDLFRAILDFSREGFQVNKATYHISADIEQVPPGVDCSAAGLQELFESDHARQVLHVGFGSVLTARNPEGHYLFRDRILECLTSNEETHYEFLAQHIQRHIIPFI